MCSACVRVLDVLCAQGGDESPAGGQGWGASGCLRDGLASPNEAVPAPLCQVAGVSHELTSFVMHSIREPLQPHGPCCSGTGVVGLQRKRSRAQTAVC